MQYLGRRWVEFASYSSVGYANEVLRRSTTVFRVRYVVASLVSRRKVSRRFTCPNFTQPMLKYGRRSRVEFQFFFLA